MGEQVRKYHYEGTYKTSLKNRTDAIAEWKGSNVMAFIVVMYVWYKIAIIAVD